MDLYPVASTPHHLSNKVLKTKPITDPDHNQQDHEDHDRPGHDVDDDIFPDENKENIDRMTHFKTPNRKLFRISLLNHSPTCLEWTSQRSSRLLDLLTRPLLLFSPSYGIRLPFGTKFTSPESLPTTLVKRNLPIDPDPCLLSIDGLLDCLFATIWLVDHVYDHFKSMQQVNEDCDYTSTLSAASYFRHRLKPALTRLTELRLKLTDFKLGACIGRGACGIVRVVREVAPPHSVYAMKSQYKGAWLHHDPEGLQILLERTVLAQATAIENPWLPHLHYAFQDDKQLHLVMDYEPGGDLYIFLSKVGHLLELNMIQFYAAEAIEAIHSLHQMGYIHCDLKPENFAIERSGHLKLLDFGSAIRLDADGKCICPTMVGTKEYLNVELLQQRERRHQESLLVGPEYDYWAIGVLLYELFYGHTPFYDDDDNVMMNKIVNYKKTLKFPPTVNIPDCAIHLIRSLITSPHKRLTYNDLVMHPFFKDFDFTTLRELTPPYLPPVGELDDVSNFSGGGTRARDEAILDVSTNETFSPSRFKQSVKNESRTHSDLSECLAEQTVVHAPVDEQPVDPDKPIDHEPNSCPRPSVETKRQAILDAAAVSIHEDIEEIEDIEWDGADAVRNLPFIGYTYTPGLVFYGNLTKGSKTVSASVGTSLIVGPKPSPTADNLNATLVDNKNVAELQQRNQMLTEQIELLRSQFKESEDTCKRLDGSFDSRIVLKEINEAVRALSTSVVEKERSTLEHLNLRIKQLHDENTRLRADLQTEHQSQSVVEQLQIAISRLSALPVNFAEADLVNLLTSLCPTTTDARPCPTTPTETTTATHSGSTNLIAYELIHRLINFSLRQLKESSMKLNQTCYSLEASNKNLSDALDASKQQVAHLVDTLDGLIADQRQSRECEIRLNKEIQELKQKLDDSKEYQRDLHQKYLQYEDKYFTMRENFKEEERKNRLYADKIEQLLTTSRPRTESSLSDLHNDHINLTSQRSHTYTTLTTDVEGEVGRLLSVLEESKRQYEQEIAELKAQIEQNKIEQERLLEDRKNDRSRLEEALKQSDSAQQKLAVLQDQLNTLRNERNRSVAQAAMESQRLSDLQLQLNDALMKKEAAEFSLREVTLKLDRLNSTQNQSIMLDQARNELDVLRSQLRDAQNDLICHKRNENSLRERILDFENELTSTRKEITLLRERYDRLQSSVGQIDLDKSAEDFAIQHSASDENVQVLKDEIDQLRFQLERLRLNNTQLLSQRDTARQEAREAELATLRMKEVGEATQQTLSREIHRLTTITEQQGKLINHMRGLLPPELTSSCSSSGHRVSTNKNSTLVSSSSNLRDRTQGLRKSNKAHTIPRAPLMTAASTFFNRRRKGKDDELVDSKTLPPTGFHKQPSRLQKMMSKTRLNFKKNPSVLAKPSHFAVATTTTEPVDMYINHSDNFSAEDDEEEGALGYNPYSADDTDYADDDDDDGGGLPVQLPTMFQCHPDSSTAADRISNAGSTSSAPSTASSAPAGHYQQYMRTQMSWLRHRSKNRVVWADGQTENHGEETQPKLLKQLSKVLTRSKQSSTHFN